MRSLVLVLGVLATFHAMAQNDTVAQGRLYQVSTIGALSQGVYDGPFTFAQLSQHGDLGLGTFNQLAGEMVAVDGHFYQINDRGDLREVKPSQKTPFAEITFFQAKRTINVGAIKSYQALSDHLLNDFNNKNIPYAVRIEGEFKWIKARNLRRQTKPYPPLVKAASEQAVFDFKKVKGTLVGFWFPHYWNGIGVSGFHLHFVNDLRTTGGHVLDLDMIKGQVKIQPMNAIDVVLPNTAAFAKVNLDPQYLHEELKKAEGGTD